MNDNPAFKRESKAIINKLKASGLRGSELADAHQSACVGVVNKLLAKDPSTYSPDKKIKVDFFEKSHCMAKNT